MDVFAEQIGGFEICEPESKKRRRVNDVAQRVYDRVRLRGVAAGKFLMPEGAIDNLPGGAERPTVGIELARKRQLLRAKAVRKAMDP